jgi:hypothetical protein
MRADAFYERASKKFSCGHTKNFSRRFIAHVSRACKKSLFLRYIFDAEVCGASARTRAKFFADASERSSSCATRDAEARARIHASLSGVAVFSVVR